MEKPLIIALIVYAIIMNIAAFCTMGLDKLAAKRKRRRVPEKVLFLLVLLGGSIGGTLGMYIFRHKTRHWYFVVGFPLILLLQLALCIFIGGASF